MLPAQPWPLRRRCRTDCRFESSGAVRIEQFRDVLRSLAREEGVEKHQVLMLRPPACARCLARAGAATASADRSGSSCTLGAASASLHVGAPSAAAIPEWSPDVATRLVTRAGQAADFRFQISVSHSGLPQSVKLVGNFGSAESFSKLPATAPPGQYLDS
jgi:hypothetical protein